MISRNFQKLNILITYGTVPYMISQKKDKIGNTIYVVSSSNCSCSNYPDDPD